MTFCPVKCCGDLDRFASYVVHDKHWQAVTGDSGSATELLLGM
jgi:hypothetical protein